MNSLKKITLGLLVTAGIAACSSDDDSSENIQVEAPASYIFTRDGSSSVSFGGQTTRIRMAEALVSNLTDPGVSLEKLNAQFDHQEGVSNFEDEDLNTSDKSIRSKVAASYDFFNANNTESIAIKTTFENWIENQVDQVFTRWMDPASKGVAGSIEEGGSNPATRYVTGQGLELNQAFAKGLIGALMLDQAINNYLSPGILDQADNRENNDAGVVADGKNYTTMEHKWDEAYGYVYGTSVDAQNPNTTIGEDDNFLNKYIGRVENDDDYTGIATDIFEAFKLGRAAIVAGAYDVRDEQAVILQNKLSEIIAIRSIYYLQQGKSKIEASTIDYADAFHDLSEGYGFIYSLQFTKNTETGTPKVNSDQVDEWLSEILPDNDGFWVVTPEALQSVSEEIAEIYDIDIEKAGS